jgi:hypothetical protein
MPTPTPIPILSGAQSALDPLAGAALQYINAMPGPDGVATRPCITPWSLFPASAPSKSPVVSITPFGNFVIYVTDDGAGTRMVYALDAVNRNVVSLDDETTATRIAGTYRPKTTTSRGFVFVSGGQQASRVSSALIASKFPTAPLAKDIATLSQYVLIAADDDSGLIYWNLPGDSQVDSWDTVFRFAEAEARPDKLIAIQASARELFAFGSQTTQVFAPDPNSYFAPVATMDLGCAARASIVNNDVIMSWLDSFGRIVQSDGRGLSEQGIISDRGLASTIKGLSTISDCWAYREVIGNSDCLVYTFPTVGRTFAYDQRSPGAWHERLGWANGNWTAYPVTSYAWWPERQAHLVGLANGTIATLTDTGSTDMGEPVRCKIRAGFIRAAAGVREPQSVRLVLRRGEADSATRAVSLEWRDDLGPFGAPITSLLHTSTTGSKADAIEKIRPVGPPYEERQYQFSWDGRASIVAAEEMADEMEI